MTLRRLVIAAVTVGLLAATPGALAKPILGLTGNASRFKAQTAQK